MEPRSLGIQTRAGARVAVKEAQGRAERLDLRLPLRYRTAGGAWHEGRIENISRSGLLFHGDLVPDVDAELEFVFTLPVASPPRIACRGRVVRVTAAIQGHGVAATIASYRFARGRLPPGAGPGS